MALQTPNVVMIGLGSDGDRPANQIQPPLVDGIHLRWAFKRQLGFPWYGFYLYRRPHQAGTPQCLSDAMGALQPGQMSSAHLNLSAAADQVTVSSDTNLTLTNTFAPTTIVEFGLSGRSFLDVTLPPGAPARRVEVRIGFGAAATVSVIAFFAGIPVVQGTVSGQAGQIKSRVLEFDSITALRVGSGPAALVDICFVPVAQGATAGWQPVAEFPVPLCLPVAQPDYPCTSSLVEKLEAARELAYRRIRYGDPELFASAPIALYADGRVDVTNGSSIVIGQDTRWTDALAGAVLHVADDPTVYTIAVVVASDKLVLTRSYTGRSATAVYTIDEDHFGQLHDYLVHLVQGGSAAGAMAARFVPLPAEDTGTIEVAAGEAEVLGSGTSWGAELDGLALQVAGEQTAYTIAGVDGPAKLRLDRGYQGTGGAGKAYVITGRLQAAEPGRAAPLMPRQRPLDLVLLGALYPAVAQMLGLYWVDGTAKTGVAYDYLLVADYTAQLGPDAHKALTRLQREGFGAVEASIVFNKRREQPASLDAPRDLRVYALPESPLTNGDETDAKTSNQAGLHWEARASNLGVLLPGQPIMYHVWRAELGNDEEPASIPPADRYEPLTRERPLVTAQPQSGLAPQRPPDWPPFPLRFIDRSLAEGWYSYQVSAIDIFGRHSPNSKPGPWYQWAPVPQPRPWYYRDPPAETALHSAAVRLLDKTPPPPPTGVEAYALDPADPAVLMDEAHVAWRALLGSVMGATVVGLRVRWLWTAAHIRQAPDTREFRIYFQRGTDPPADPSTALNWQERFAVVGYDEHVAVTADAEGRPLRRYEIFLIAPGEGFSPTLAEPIAYAHLGVSAADDKTHTKDDPAWESSGDLGGRYGNEGPVGGPARVFLVNRQPPPRPAPIVEPERAYATAADYHGHSFYTYRWQPQAHVKVHILRALDDALFNVDWAQRPRPALAASQAALFPPPAADPRWDAAKRQQVAGALNQLNGFGHDAAGTAAAMRHYRALSDDALRVLAGLPGNERAFTQRTIQPLDPDDPATANRLGPDNPPDFPLNPALRAYVDTLDGRATNRFFYRALAVDGAHNRSALNLAGAPLYLPNVVPPRAPVITKIVGGEGQISIRWASNREADLAEYRVYRAEEEAGARDLRLMTPVHTEPVPGGEPAARPAELEWVDAAVGRALHYYRVVAVDSAGNLSAPSAAASGRAYDQRPPDPPAWVSAAWNGAGTAIELRWSPPAPDLQTIVQRNDFGLWRPVSPWLPQGSDSFANSTAGPGRVQRYRLRVRNEAGNVNIVYLEAAIEPPERTI